MPRYPSALRPGDRIGVTAPSSGVETHLLPRFEACLDALRAQGFDVVTGRVLDGASHVSASKEERATELMSMLTDPEVRAVFPPWGGETAIDLLDVLDWDALAQADPTWVIGFSDTTTWMLPLTLRLDWATLHGAMLMDETYPQPDGLARWADLAAGDGPVTQRGTGRHHVGGWADWEGDPGQTTRAYDGTGSWLTLEPGPVDVTGRLVGGCIETVVNLAGTPYGDLPAWAAAQPEGTIVYLEACGDDAFTICRGLHGLRLAGWFDNARAIVIGRTPAPDTATLTQHEAVRDALGMLGVPVVLDVECGHVSPRMPMVNGALARLVVDGDRHEITQELV
ncbi:LD-carboxypeptidase [Nocardioides guangzhouensis]|uniref:LD-carboxypeptidase n=1 Tax=Nocardioides guangzhouensis TaxID=2497878 RepID=A0A4Q4ZN66_9ACTN|nr:S66 peptidase family protein [Nocardioides guangzhouensis]RYP88924.1 LD-carboxypeptidase [Nocardioides guangzhouensis]